MNKRLTSLLLLATLSSLTAFGGDTIFVEHFDTQEAFDKFKTVDSNSDGSTWAWDKDSHDARCLYSGQSLSSDDWLLTPEQSFKAGRVYSVSYHVYGDGLGYREHFATGWGSGTAVASYTTLQPRTLIDHSGSDFTNNIVCTADGNYRVGFHAVSDALQFGVSLDDIVIADVASVNAPAAVGALRGTAADDGTNAVTLVFRTPFRTAGGGSLSSISKVEIYRNGTLISTIDGPAVNRSQNYTDTEASNGTNTYTVIAYNDEGAGIPATVEVYAGEDKPGAVSNVVLSDEGGKIVLHWDAPKQGANSGYFDASHCTYNVYYAGDYQAGRLYKSGITETAVAIDGNDGAQRVSGFYVSAVNAGGEGNKVASNDLLLGKPYTMPVIQDFGSSFSSHFKNFYDNWTDDDGHIWWREGNGTSMPKYSTEGYVLFYDDGYNSSNFNSGKIDFKNVVNPRLSFAFQPYYESDEMNVYAVKPDGSKVQLINVSYAEQRNRQWKTYTVDLSLLKGLDYAVLKFIGNSDDEGLGAALDNIQIVDATEHNLNARLIAPSRVMAGLPSTAQVIVNNFGTAAAQGYTVSLYADGEKVAEHVAAATLPSMAVDTVAMNFTARPGVDTLKVYAVVDYAEDENTADNTTLTAPVVVEQPAMAAVTDLRAAKGTSSNTLSWTAIVPVSEQTTDDMESYPAFTLPGDGHYLEYEYNIGPWYNYDEDQEYSLDLPGYSFPWEEEAFAYITFNPDKVTTDDSATTPFSQLSGYGAHSGKQYLTAFSMKNDMAVGNHVSDWLISPLLTGDAQTVSFWFNTLPVSNGTVSFQVAYSTTDSLYDSFTHVVADSVTAVSGWTKVSVDLPKGAKYFAIHHLTPVGINQMLMLDDISYTTGIGEVLGYRVYRDGKYLATVTTPAYTDSEGGDHDYNVSVVYNSGEGALSNTATTKSATAITTVISSPATTGANVLYNLSGERVGSDYRGVVIQNGHKFIKK